MIRHRLFPHHGRLFLLFMIFLFLGGATVGLQGEEILETLLEERAIPNRVLVLVDTSYSMGYRFPDTGFSNRDVGVAGLRDFIDRMAGRKTDWALAVFAERDSFELIRGFEKNTHGLMELVRRTDPWGPSDISGGIGSALDILSELDGGVCFVISDLVETENALYSLPILGDLEGKNILYLVQKAAEAPNDLLRARLERWAELQGDVFFYERGILSGVRPRKPSIPAEAVGEAKNPYPDGVKLAALSGGDSPGGKRYSWEMVEYRSFALPFFRLHRQSVRPFVSGAVFFLLFLGTMMLIVSFRTAYRRKQDTTPRFERFLHYFHRYGGEELEEKVLEFPEKGDTVVVALPGDNRCEISLREDRLFIECEQPILVDGVSGRKRKIREGSILLAENHRFFIGKMEVLRSSPELKKLPLRNELGYLVFLFASGAALFLFTLASILVPVESEKMTRFEWVAREPAPSEAAPAEPVLPEPDLPEPAPAEPPLPEADIIAPAAEAPPKPPREPEEPRRAEPREVRVPEEPRRAEPEEAKVPEEKKAPEDRADEITRPPSTSRWATAFSGGASERQFQYTYGRGNPLSATPPIVVELGREPGSEGWNRLPPRTAVDVLFLHAHPDDEAIDFGGLLAKLSQGGKRTGVVLFTDGESGLSRGPYTKMDLAPTVLSSIRVKEAASSMAELGCSLYVRLGYRNHPYSSASHVLDIEEVYRAWGGKAGLRRQVASLIERLDPEVVISIDGDSRALIHFEHEAVGNIVREALEELEKDGKKLPEGYLVSINPRDHHKYGGASPIPVMEPVRDAPESPVSVQLRALKQHASQIDAGVVALEYLPFFDSSWVEKVYWNLSSGLEEYF